MKNSLGNYLYYGLRRNTTLAPTLVTRKSDFLSNFQLEGGVNDHLGNGALGLDIINSISSDRNVTSTEEFGDLILEVTAFEVPRELVDTFYAVINAGYPTHNCYPDRKKTKNEVAMGNIFNAFIGLVHTYALTHRKALVGTSETYIANKFYLEDKSRLLTEIDGKDNYVTASGRKRFNNKYKVMFANPQVIEGTAYIGCTLYKEGNLLTPYHPSAEEIGYQEDYNYLYKYFLSQMYLKNTKEMQHRLQSMIHLTDNSASEYYKKDSKYTKFDASVYKQIESQVPYSEHNIILAFVTLYSLTIK